MTIVEVQEVLLEHLRQNVKPLFRARDIMFFPVKSVEADATIEEARVLMVKYNINALPVVSDNRVMGIITRQIVGKAAFHELQDIPVREYMSTESSTVEENDSIEKVKEIVIGNNQRFVPVVRDGALIGAITRTDLLRVLEDEIAKAILGKLESHDLYKKHKNVRKLMDERLDGKTLQRLKDIGALADSMGYHAFLVGGVVRDLLLRIENYDIDIVIEGDGLRFAEEMTKAFRVRVRPHSEFATAKVIYPDGFKIDIATARLEYYKAPAALPIVEHSSLKLDLHRRDFTINTLAISLNKNNFGQMIDFFGGQRDIKERTIRVLHSLSFVEDPTRVFRAVRFEHRFGFQIGKHSMNLIRNTIKLGFLSKIRGKRLWSELTLILLEEEPERILRRLHELDLLRFVSIHLIFDKDKEKLFHQMHDVYRWYELLYRDEPCDKISYYVLGLVDHMNPSDISDFCRKTEMTERLRRKAVGDMEGIRDAKVKLSYGLHAMKKSEAYKIYEALSQEARLFIMARTKSDEVKRSISNYITLSETFRPLVTGEDLKNMDIKEGPVYREILDKLREAKVDNNLKTKEEEIAFVNTYLSGRGIAYGHATDAP